MPRNRIKREAEAEAAIKHQSEDAQMPLSKIRQHIIDLNLHTEIAPFEFRLKKQPDVDSGFEQRWKEHPKPQATTESMFWTKTSWNEEYLRGKTVLDAGCGVGRFSKVVIKHGGIPICIDSSPKALTAARENIVEPALFIQADLLQELPLPEESVDAAFSIGTLHHTGNTHQALHNVARAIKLGGQFAIWVYTQPVTDAKLLPVLNMLHEITKSVPPSILHDIFARYAPEIRDIYSGAWGPLHQILRISNSADNEECISDSFDWHTPRYRDWHTEAEIVSWFREIRFIPDHIGAFPVTVRAQKQ